MKKGIISGGILKGSSFEFGGNDKLKMGDYFYLPLAVNNEYESIYEGKKQVFKPNFNFLDYSFKTAAAVQAINNHDQLVEQLASAKAEIAEYRDALEELASCFALLANDEGSCAADGYFDYSNAKELLAKHKGVSDEQ